jgi:uncharacterized protein YjiK
MPNRIGAGAVAWGSPRSSQAVGPAKFGAPEKAKLDIVGASDITALPGGKFAVVADRRDVLYLTDGNTVTDKLHLPGVKDGSSMMEGVAFDPENNHLYITREEKHELVRFEWNPGGGSKPSYDKKFELSHGGPLNKGFEGLTFMPSNVSPTGQSMVVLAKEASPREILFRGSNGGGNDLKLDLDDDAKKKCKDFSAVAVDPKTGDLFVSSQESSNVLQIKLTRDGDKIRGKIVQEISLVGKHGKPLDRVEGLTFDAKGNMLALSETAGDLYTYPRK